MRLACIVLMLSAPALAQWTEEVTVPSAPYQHVGVPSAIVHAPPGFDPARPLRIVVYLHGWMGCVRVLVERGELPCREGERSRYEGWGLAAAHDASGSDALLVVPQLALMERDGRPGAFLEPQRFRTFLAELFAALPARLPSASVDRIASVTLMAHSAGFETALALLARGGVPLHAIVLFDALYRGVEPFGEFARSDPTHRFLTFHTRGGRTERQTQLLFAWARREHVAVARDPADLAAALRDHPIAAIETRSPHGNVPAAHWAQVIAALGLRR